MKGGKDKRKGEVVKDITANREAAHVSPCQPSRLAARSLASSPNSSSTPHCTFGNHIFKYSTNISFLLFSSLVLLHFSLLGYS